MGPNIHDRDTSEPLPDGRESGGAEQDMSIATTRPAGASVPADDEARLLPMRPPAPLPIVLKYDHIKTENGGWVTAIVRIFAEPEKCGLCPRCDHSGGVCLVRAPEYVEPSACARYRLRNQG